MQIIDLNPHDIIVPDTGIREEIGDVSGLAATIADQGMLQPLGVIARGDGTYQLVYGHRRRSAAISLGLNSVPCLVFADDDRQLIRQLTENLQRRDLNDLEQAKAFARVREQFKERQPDADEGVLDDHVAQTVGLSPRSVRRYLGLLDLDESIQAYLRSGQLTVTQAQHLRRIGNDHTRLELARAAVDEGMSAAELSRLASYFAANPEQSLDSAIHALQQPARASDNVDPFPFVVDETPVPQATHLDHQLPTHTHTPDSESGYLHDDSVIGSTKLRQSRIKSLDQLVDETDRMLRAYTDGHIQRWIDSDDSAQLKVGMVIVQLRRLLVALNTIATAEQWPIESE